MRRSYAPKVYYASGDRNQATDARSSKGKAEKDVGGAPEDGCVGEEIGEVGPSDINPEIPRHQSEGVNIARITGHG